MWFRECWNAILIFFTKVWVVTEREYASMPTLFHLDDYDQCMLYGQDALYCSISLQLHPKDHSNVSEVWKIMQRISSEKTYYKHDLLRHGICVTERCPNVDKSGLLKYNSEDVNLLNECYSARFQHMGLVGEIVQIHCESNGSAYSPNKYDFLYPVIIFILVASVLFAWIYDVFQKSNLQDQTFRSSLFGKYISSFSVSQNWRRLTRVDVTHPDAKALSCLQAIRLLSVSIVLVTHTSFANLAIPVANPRYAEHFMDSKIYDFFGRTTRHNTMGIFFFMSTWFVTCRFYMECDGKKKVPFSYFIHRVFNRYLRLTPLVAVVVLFEATTWFPYFSNGPLWESIIGIEHRLCRKNWWTNLVYINNFWGPHHETCSNHLWYLAVDMQFYITTLIILCLMRHYPKKTPLILGSVWLIHIFAASYKIASQKNQYVASPESAYNMTLVNLNDSLGLINDNTMNLPGLLAGIIYASLFCKYKNQNLFTQKSYVVLWWSICWGTIIAVYITPGIIINFLNKNVLLLYVYFCLSRTFFIGAFGLFIFGTTQGQGGTIKNICEWPPIYILGRLTYAVYLIHPIFEKYKIAMLRAPNYVSDYTLAFDSIGVIARSFLLAVPITLFFEMPFEQFKTQILFKPKTKTEANSVKVH